MDHIVVDVEIQKAIQETPGGWNATDKLGVACAVVYEFLTDRYLVYGPSDVHALQERILIADRVSGFNTWKFDFPVIWGLPGRECVTQLRSVNDDLLRRIWEAQGLDPDVFTDRHKGWSLDAVTKGTFGRGKTGYGGDAPIWFQQGEWARLITYCIDDVKLERDLTRFIDEHGFVVHENGCVVRISPWNVFQAE